MKYFSQALPASIAMLVVASASLFSPVTALAGCDGVAPKAPAGIWASPGPGAGQVTLTWSSSDWANRYAVEYGTKSNTYMYGANNIGGQGAMKYTVGALAPGQTYFFRVAAAHDCNSSGFSYEVSAPAAGGALSMAPERVTLADAKQMATAMVNSMMPDQKPAPMSWAGPVGKEHLMAKSGPGVGEVTISWADAESADNFHVMYGTGGGYQYGALNIGKVSSFKISHLAPGTSYKVAIVPVQGSRALYTNDPVMITAMAPVAEAPVLGISDEVQPAEIPETVEQAVPEVEQAPVVDEQSQEQTYQADSQQYDQYAQANVEDSSNDDLYNQEPSDEYTDDQSGNQTDDQMGTGSTGEYQGDNGAQQSDY
jgi:hypothetical protein